MAEQPNYLPQVTIISNGPLVEGFGEEAGKYAAKFFESHGKSLTIGASF